MKSKNLKQLRLNEKKFAKMCSSFGFKYSFLGRDLVLVKSKFDAWQLELIYEKDGANCEIQLNHKNRTINHTNETRVRYHVQGYYTSWVGVLKYIQNHDRYISSQPKKRVSGNVRRLNRMQNLFNKIEEDRNKTQSC